MELLQLREKEIFETLKKIRKFKFVVIGGYAVNAYTLPRFSVDCDIVVEDNDEANKIGKVLERLDYNKEDANKINILYGGKFIRYEKDIGNNLKVSVDILIKNILDRQTNANFSAKWIFENSEVMSLKGKTITEELNLRIINADALIVMKSTSCRIADIRDVFMILTKAKDLEWIKKEIGKRYGIENRLNKIVKKVTSTQFKDNLQGIYGYIDENLFEKQKNYLLRFSKLD
ncbi:hypothetical protein KY361_04350 [Candidatus Woesearchaeota archaeon]|nr:hypothetical protein [Candidatus Woesearchaeota archaeon]